MHTTYSRHHPTPVPRQVDRREVDDLVNSWVGTPALSAAGQVSAGVGGNNAPSGGAPMTVPTLKLSSESLESYVSSSSSGGGFHLPIIDSILISLYPGIELS